MGRVISEFAAGDTYTFPPQSTEAEIHKAWVEIPRATFVASGSKAKRIDAAPVTPPGGEAGIQVRVLEGPHVGFTGWTSSANLVAN